MTDDASTGFRPTGPAGVRGETPLEMQDPKTQLGRLLAASVAHKPFSELSDVTFHHRGAELVGHVLLDTVEEAGYTLDDFDAVGALTAAAVPLVTSMITAAASRGQDLDGFVMDFVYPSVKGPSIKGKRVILVDSWLSEKSYVQTSSLVTLRNGNELSLDFGIVGNEGAEVLAVAALIGGPFDALKVIHPVTGDETDLPFIRAFDEDELRAEADDAADDAATNA
ncbi:orotate phosphoribosyltransferase [Bifidobacterium avesanii]|uniref:Orotate phosphoribosyltransferase n=2 Tax=Bifidobacterium avesanii TaxID=1798157 RepID=A0A7K3TF40_9BIFI|nr:orotate phosphoribosyltransferase [Bifidobacterium avesanii]